MAVLTLDELFPQLSAGQVLVGLDLGTKTIGVALSDGGRSFAVPKHVITRTKFTQDANALIKFSDDNKAAAFVIGLPVNMDGSEGPRAQATRAFVRNIERMTPLPCIFWDERLSTVAAERAMIEMDMSRAKRAERIDAAAAAFILQGALDRRYAISRGNSSTATG
jgi:putative holliday junction resolvase